MILPSITTTDLHHTLNRRAYGYCVRDGRYGYYPSCKRSGWSRFGRWLLAAILLFLAISIISLTLCCVAFRRRKSKRNKTNSAPMNSAPQPSYYNAPQNYQTPPPPPPPTEPPKYGGPEAYGGPIQPSNVHIQ